MMNEKTTGVLTVFMYLTVPMGDRVRPTRKNLVKLGGMTYQDATEAVARFTKENGDISAYSVYAQWQPHPIEIQVI